MFCRATNDEYIDAGCGVIAELLAPELGVPGVVIAVYPKVDERYVASGRGAGECAVAVKADGFAGLLNGGGQSEEAVRQNLYLENTFYGKYRE